jgi:hypothetical protein
MRNANGVVVVVVVVTSFPARFDSNYSKPIETKIAAKLSLAHLNFKLDSRG